VTATCRLIEVRHMSQSLPSTAAEAEPKRRDFLTLLTVSGAAIGLGAVAWPFIDSMEPASDSLAAGGPVDVDLSKLQPGQQIVVMWRGDPIFVVDRPPAEQKTLQDPQLLAVLRDPNSDVLQQPPYARNWHRSIDPQYAVMVGICTHLGCIPKLYPNPSASDPAPNWLGGYLCPCHGSKYDLAGRVFQAVPAPYNLPVPPYHFPSPKILRIGENPRGVAYEIGSVVQM
jgi:ubiquinol-cytochrome c reductase iron-sulfur subunit